MKNFFRNTCLSFVILGAGFCTDVTAMHERDPLLVAAEDGTNKGPLAFDEKQTMDKTVPEEKPEWLKELTDDLNAAQNAAVNDFMAKETIKELVNKAIKKITEVKEEVNEQAMAKEIIKELVNKAIKKITEVKEEVNEQASDQNAFIRCLTEDLNIANELFKSLYQQIKEMEDPDPAGNVLLYKKNDGEYVVLTSTWWSIGKYHQILCETFNNNEKLKAVNPKILTVFDVVNGIEFKDGKYKFNFDSVKAETRKKFYKDEIEYFCKNFDELKSIANKTVNYLKLLKKTLQDQYKDADKKLFDQIQGVEGYNPEEKQIVTKDGVDTMEAFGNIIKIINDLLEKSELEQKEQEKFVNTAFLIRLLRGFLGHSNDSLIKKSFTSLNLKDVSNNDIDYNKFDSYRRIVNFAFHTEAQATVLQAIDEKNFGSFKILYSYLCPCSSCTHLPLTIESISKVAFLYLLADTTFFVRFSKGTKINVANEEYDKEYNLDFKLRDILYKTVARDLAGQVTPWEKVAELGGKLCECVPIQIFVDCIGKIKECERELENLDKNKKEGQKEIVKQKNKLKMILVPQPSGKDMKKLLEPNCKISIVKQAEQKK